MGAAEQAVVTISLLATVRDPSLDALRETIRSLLGQVHNQWELCVVDDASESLESWTALERYAATDSRMRIHRRSEPGGASRASNDALALASGDFVAVIDTGDLLVRDAIGEIVNALTADPEIDLCYSDEARLMSDGKIGAPFYKPDWSPERMRSQLFTGRLSVLRRTLVSELGGFRSEFDGCHDRELALRVSERARRIVHVPQALYLARATSEDREFDGMPYAIDAGRLAVQEHCNRVGVDAVVEPLPAAVGYRVRRQVRFEPLVSIVVPTRGSASRVGRVHRTHILHAVSSVLERSTFANVEFVVIADRETPVSVIERLKQLCDDRLRLVWSDGPFNFSRKINDGVEVSTGEIVILLNDDVEVQTPDWIEVLVGLVREATCGLVGCKLVDGFGRLQHGGHVYADGEMLHAYARYPASEVGMAGLLEIDRECSGVTAACVAVRREIWEQVGGMCEALPVNFNDVDFCLKIRRLGLRIIWTPHAVLSHFESMTRANREVSETETDFVRRRWRTALASDPYSNPNLDQTHGDWVVARPPECWIS